MRRTWLVVALASLPLAGVLTVIAGPLNPPAGSVSPTYKTLTEVEPRVAVSSANTPPSASAVFRISQPGSYYLTGNVTGVAGKHGIEITTNNVTLDLNGFEVVGIVGAGAFDGVTVVTAPGVVNGTTVLNGSVRAWGRIGVNLAGNNSSSNNRIEGVRASNCGGVGFSTGSHSVISACTASNNNSNGLVAQLNCTVTGCTAVGNTFTGIATNDGCTVVDCTSSDNGTHGFVVGASSITSCAAYANAGNGISVASEGTATSCTASENAVGISGGVGASIIGCVANSNTQTGISINDGGSIINCSTRGNAGDNIRCADGCLVRDNSCFANSVAPSATNLHATGGENRIENNTCTGATGRGFDIDVAGNIIIGNTARGNGINWDVAAGNVCLVIQAPNNVAFSGNAGGTSPSTNPWANFTY